MVNYFLSIGEYCFIRLYGTKIIGPELVFSIGPNRTNHINGSYFYRTYFLLETELTLSSQQTQYFLKLNSQV